MVWIRHTLSVSNSIWKWIFYIQLRTCCALRPSAAPSDRTAGKSFELVAENRIKKRKLRLCLSSFICRAVWLTFVSNILSDIGIGLFWDTGPNNNIVFVWKFWVLEQFCTFLSPALPPVPSLNVPQHTKWNQCESLYLSETVNSLTVNPDRSSFYLLPRCCPDTAHVSDVMLW